MTAIDGRALGLLLFAAAIILTWLILRDTSRELDVTVNLLLPERDDTAVRACDHCRRRYYIPADHLLTVLDQREWWCKRCIDTAVKEWTA